MGHLEDICARVSVIAAPCPSCLHTRIHSYIGTIISTFEGTHTLKKPPRQHEPLGNVGSMLRLPYCLGEIVAPRHPV